MGDVDWRAHYEQGRTDLEMVHRALEATSRELAATKAELQTAREEVAKLREAAENRPSFEAQALGLCCPSWAPTKVEYRFECCNPDWASCCWARRS